MTRGPEKSRNLVQDEADLGVSTRALAIARMVDRICRTPGNYQIHLTISSHRRAPWTLEIQKSETLRKVELKR